MGNISYKARAFFVLGEKSLYRQAPIESFLVTGGKAVSLSSTNDTILFHELEQAETQKNLTFFKIPSEDDLDSVLSGFFQSKAKFGLNFDVYVNYTGNSWIQIAHFFGQDASIKSQPVRVGAGKTLSQKIEFAFPKGYFKHASQQKGLYVDDEEWIR